jgi:hypothetical protein
MSNLERKRVVAMKLGRHSSSNKAVWQTLEFTAHMKLLTVVCLSVLLKNGQHIYVSEVKL